MVYILCIYEVEAFGSEYIYNNKREAFKDGRMFRSCYDKKEIHIEIYEALNEYTVKRQLIKKF